MSDNNVKLVLRHTISCHRAPVTALLYDPDGEVMFSASADSTVSIHTMNKDPHKEPKFQHRLHRDRAQGINAIAMHDNKLLTAGDDYAVLWDLKVQRSVFTFTKHSLPVTDCDIFESYVLTSSADQTLILFDMRFGKPISTMRTHSSPVLSCKLLKRFDSVGSERIGAISGGVDGMIRLWNPIQGNALVTTKPGRPVSSIEVSPNEKYILCSTVGSGAALHTLPTDNGKLEIPRIKEYKAHENAEYLLPANYMWLNNSKMQMITCGTSQNQVVFYDIRKADSIITNPIVLPSAPLAFASSASYQLLGVGCMDSRIQLFSLLLD